MLKGLLFVLACLMTSRAQVLNPNVPVLAQCYYHTFIGGGVNHCTQGLVPNCVKNQVPGFSYEACNCNLTLSNGIDVIFVLDQLPYTTTDGPAESLQLWEDYLDILQVAIEPILRRSPDNFIGVIRPTATGCDTFGPILKQGDLVSNFSGTFPYRDLGPCGASACPPNVIQSGTCAALARSTLLARPQSRRKIIVSMRHQPGNGGFNYVNEPANNLQYFVITTRPRASFAVPGTFVDEFDYGGITKANNMFVLTSTNQNLIGITLNPAATPTIGFIPCETIWPYIRRDVLPSQRAATNTMICTYFPNGPGLTWMTTLTTGQNVVRRTIPALTSWLCQLTPPTSAPTLSPTRNPTVCRGPPPVFPPPSTPVCATQCASSLTVDPQPFVLKPTPTTTRMCWNYQVQAGGSSQQCLRATSVTRVSFIMDECCPDGAMNFVDEISFGGPVAGTTSYMRSQCPVVSSGIVNDAFNQRCTRYQRTCANGGGNNPGNQCTVYSINNMRSSDVNGQFCLVLAGGQNYDVAPVDGRLDANQVELAQMCIERMDPFNPSGNVCDCTTVQFIRSRDRCQHTSNPSSFPTKSPTTNPSKNPTKSPTRNPTKSPTKNPTKNPSNFPTKSPTFTENPTKNPTKNPSKNPTKNPTVSPSKVPTASPTDNPSSSPTRSPSKNPSKNPSVSPTQSPTKPPSNNPTVSPTQSPTKNPTTSPSKNPSGFPTTSPSLSPTACTGPPPDYVRPDCQTQLCNNPVNEQVVSVIPNPTLTELSGPDRTRLCWNYRLTNFGGAQCATNGAPIRGVSFIMDECCPDGVMEFIEAIDMATPAGQVVSQTRATCPLVGPASNPGAHNPDCSRATRPCSGAVSNQMCTVVSLNNLAIGSTVGAYCLTIPGKNWKNPSNNQMKNSVRQFAKLCFERGTANPFALFNVCSCITVDFVDSKLVCDDTPNPTVSPSKMPSKTPTKNPTTTPTKNPTKTPSANPTTSSPTGCQGPPRDFNRKNCQRTCNNANGNVNISMIPTVTVDMQQSTTKLCYDITMKPAALQPSCAFYGDRTIRGVSFLLDECCPVPMMDFLEEVSFGSSSDDKYSVRNGQCPISVSDPYGASEGCFRTQRSCGAITSAGKNCSVVNLNGLEYSGNGPVKYCVTLPGVNYNTVNPARIDANKREVGKICVENGRETGMNNICSCVDVEIVKSNVLCQATRSPSMSPTSQTPTQGPTQNPTQSGMCPTMVELPSKPSDRTCKYPCGDNEMAEWDPYLDYYEYKPDYDVTVFKYCVDMDYEWYKQHYACIARGKTRVSDIAHVTFRIDKCCELCLDKDHFYEVKPGGVKKMMITNEDDLTAPYFMIDPVEEHEAKCYTLKVNGKVGLQPGWMCVKGGYKCDCTEVDVPFSCDLKKFADPKCESESKSESKDVWWGGRSRSSKQQKKQSRTRSRGRGWYGGRGDDESYDNNDGDNYDDGYGYGYGYGNGYGRGRKYGGGYSRRGGGRSNRGGGWRR